jgi:hypothetical protein
MAEVGGDCRGLGLGGEFSIRKAFQLLSSLSLGALEVWETGGGGMVELACPDANCEISAQLWV